MRYICSRQKMQEIDKRTIEQFGIPAPVLMERAALAVFVQLDKRYQAGAECLLLVGAGNNGGDGLALARMLFEAGWHVHVYLVGKHKRSQDCQSQLAILQKLAEVDETGSLVLSELISAKDIESLKDRQYDVIADSIFGIGLTRDLIFPERDVIETVNAMSGYKVAIDIASGLDADTGCMKKTAFMADLTVTFGYAKQGMYMCMGPEVSGEIAVADIGFPKAAAGKAGRSAFTYDRADLERLPARRKTSNKGTYGKVAVIAGCETMAGAAYFSAAAAYRGGAGLVKIYSHSANRGILLSKLPEAIYEAYDAGGVETEGNAEQAGRVIALAVQFADVLVVGPGLGQSDMASMLVKASLSQQEVPVILDGDGLNILSEHMDWLTDCKTELVITPHLREMERLSGTALSDIQKNTMETVRAFAKEWRLVCVLKGAHTIVTDGGEAAYINTTGNNGMSTGGTGDVLTGVIAAFAAANMVGSAGDILTVHEKCIEAARLGVMVHGMAGDEAAGRFGERGLLAGDMPEAVGRVLRGIK